VIVVACERHVEQSTPGARVATVEVTPPTATVPVGQTVQLTATPQDSTDAPLPDRPVAWTSDNPAVASVDVNGVATGNTPGSATITATSEGKSGVSHITVTEIPSVPVATVTVSPPTATVEVDPDCSADGDAEGRQRWSAHGPDGVERRHGGGDGERKRPRDRKGLGRGDDHGHE